MLILVMVVMVVVMTESQRTESTEIHLHHRYLFNDLCFNSLKSSNNEMFEQVTKNSPLEFCVKFNARK